MGKIGASPRLGQLKCTSLGGLLAYPTKIGLGLKGLPGTNTLAYYEKSQIMSVKSFITLFPGVGVIKLFTAVSYIFS